MILTFNPREEFKTVEYIVKPVFHINRIVFSPHDSDWTNQLFGSLLIISIQAFNESGELVAGSQNQLSIGALISPNHSQPVFEVNKRYDFSEISSVQNISQATQWILKLELNNLVINDGQQLDIDFMDTKYIDRRAEDWKSRVHNVIQNITNWLANEDNCEVRVARKQRMEEGLMKSFNVPFKEIDAVDIFKNGKMKLTIRPFGLWIMGANGRIDLTSEKGNFILVDHAEQFEQTQWKLFQKNNRQNWVEFNKESLLNILS